MAKLIGRKAETAELAKLYESDKAQLVAIYGRRRVGKTFLVDEFFKGKLAFRHAGLSPINDGGKRNLMKEQLRHFYFSLQLHGAKKSKCPASWFEAFFMLEQLLESKDTGNRQVVFLDELPWMDTPRSNFISAFEGFWNTWGCHRDNLMIIVCGSANSWILNNLIDSHGGLYGRTTYEIKLSPFRLNECEEFFKDRGVMMSRYDIAQSYMVMGGVPYYMDYFNRGLSLAQNIDRLFFSSSPKLRDEFDRLLSSMFNSPSEMKKIITLLGTTRKGLTRQEISNKTGIEDAGGLTNMLRALIVSDFVSKYIPFGFDKRSVHYRLIDPFCKFHLHFVDGKDVKDSNYWTEHVNSQEVVSWRGYAFEDVCFNHIENIKAALGIQGLSTRQSTWSTEGTPNEQGTQIDLLIERKDNVVNMCEIKFYSDDFAVDKQYTQVIARRTNALAAILSKRTAIHSTLITTFGLKYNEYSDAFQKVITLDDLFR